MKSQIIYHRTSYRHEIIKCGHKETIWFEKKNSDLF